MDELTTRNRKSFPLKLNERSSLFEKMVHCTFACVAQRKRRRRFGLACQVITTTTACWAIGHRCRHKTVILGNPWPSTVPCCPRQISVPLNLR